MKWLKKEMEKDISEDKSEGDKVDITEVLVHFL